MTGAVVGFVVLCAAVVALWPADPLVIESPPQVIHGSPPLLVDGGCMVYQLIDQEKRSNQLRCECDTAEEFERMCLNADVDVGPVHPLKKPALRDGPGLL